MAVICAFRFSSWSLRADCLTRRDDFLLVLNGAYVSADGPESSSSPAVVDTSGCGATSAVLVDDAEDDAQSARAGETAAELFFGGAVVRFF